MKRDFVDALREGEAAREGQTLRQGAAYRIGQDIQAGRARRSPGRRRLLAVAAALALPVVALLALWMSQPGPAPGPARPHLVQTDPPEPEPLAAPAADGTIAVGGGAWRRDDAARLRVASTSGATLLREPTGLRVVEGTAEFEVDRRAPGEEKVVVLVSHGRIEVVGTHFTVVQHADGGEVTLHEGSIRFLTPDDREVPLSPGETLRWPLPQAVATVTPEPAPEQGPAPEPSPERRTPKQAPKPPAVDVPQLIGELETLRQQRKFEEAVAKLQGALAQDLPPSSAERLSYELGDILTWQLRDKQRGCEVWAAHRARHGQSGRYAAEVTRAQRSLGCR